MVENCANGTGNIVQFGHVNVSVPDQQLAHAFYVVGLGLTRDPYTQTGLGNMHINVGRTQFHLPTRKPSLLPGHVGIVMPGREALLARLAEMRAPLDGTEYSFTEQEDYVAVASPWGNRYRVYEPSPRFAPMWLGIAYVEFEVAEGAAAGIARFYETALMAATSVADDEEGRVALVRAGAVQHLLFREVPGERPVFDGHHIQIYVSDHHEPLRHLRAMRVTRQESAARQIRFTDIVDPDGGKLLLQLEHEVRPVSDPAFVRPLANRNPMQGMVDYTAGYQDQWVAPAI